MNLNLYLIADYLTAFSFQTRFVDDLSASPLTSLRLFDPEQPLYPSRLYLAAAADLPALIIADEPCSIICIGTPPDAYLKSNLNLLVLDSEVSLTRVFNAVEEIFLRFNQWEAQLQTVFYTKKSIKALCDASLDVFINPISVYTSDLKLICYAEREKPDQLMLFNTTDNEQYLSIDEINALKIDTDFIHTINTRAPEIFPKDIFGYRILIHNLHLQNVYVARICISETDRPIKNSDFLLIQTLAFYSELCLRDHGDQPYNHHPKDFDSLLTELLSHREVDARALEKYLNYYHWNQSDAFCCCQLPISSYEKSTLTANALAFQLSTHISGSCVSQYDNAIVLIINLTQSGKTRNQHLANLAYFIRDGIIKAGVSNEFNGFAKLSAYYQQAKIAYEVGSLYDETLWCYRYEYYALPFLIARSSAGYDPEVLCASGLLRLREYDQKRGRNYCEVLKVYLENNMNIAKTIRILFLQRATFLYQLKRITEIAHLNLSDYPTRLHLLLSFQILEQQNRC